jgi:hypothetical protein
MPNPAGSNVATYSRTEIDAAVGGTIATVENRSGATVVSTSAGTWLTGMSIVIPPTTKDVWIEWGIPTQLTVGGEGVVQTLLYEFTGGGAVIVGLCAHKYQSSAVAATYGDTHDGRVGIGSSAIARTFSLYLATYSATSSGITAAATPLNNNYGRFYMTAEAR